MLNNTLTICLNNVLTVCFNNTLTNCYQYAILTKHMHSFLNFKLFCFDYHCVSVIDLHEFKTMALQFIYDKKIFKNFHLLEMVKKINSTNRVKLFIFIKQDTH